MYTYKAKLQRVVDGDTIDATIDLSFDIFVKKRIRFAGINAPESRTRDLEENIDFELHSEELGKFGRVLGRIYLNKLDGKDCLTQVCLNELLVKEKHAVEYHGGKR